jgi:hypothetical protein
MTAFTQKQEICTCCNSSHTYNYGRIENVGHKLLMVNFLSPPQLCDDLLTKNINCCGTVRPIENAYGFWKETESEMD